MIGLEPKVRFLEFADEWGKHIIDELFEERDERSSEGELISVTINSGVIRASELSRHDNSSEDKSHYKRVKAGDIAYNTMRMWQGASGYSEYSGILSPAYTVAKPNEGVDACFFSYMFKKPELIHQFEINSQGLTKDTWNLKFPQFAKIKIISPKYDEQIKISEFLHNLDKWIAICQYKYVKLQNLKKSMLENMFPIGGADIPKIRVKGFTGAWKQHKVGEVTEELNQYTTFQSGFPLLTSSRSGLMMQSEYRDNASTDNQDTLFSVIPMGACTYRHMSDDDIFHFNLNEICENGLVSREYPVFTASNGNNLSAIIQYLNSSAKFRAFCREQKMGGTRTRLYYKSLCTFELLLPTKNEQDQIATVLKKIDDLITLHQQELEKLKNLKKALLERMFV